MPTAAEIKTKIRPPSDAKVNALSAVLAGKPYEQWNDYIDVAQRNEGVQIKTILANSVIVPSPPVPPVPSPTPSLTDPFGLAHQHLTLPVDKNGGTTGNNALAITGSALVGGYTSKYFQRSPTSLTFVCPDFGTYTSTATHPRVELRDEDEWSVNEHHVSRVIKFAILDAATTLSTSSWPGAKTMAVGQEVILHQIHDASEPCFKLYGKRQPGGFDIYAKIKTHDGDADKSYGLLTGVQFGQVVTSSFEWTPSAGGQALKLMVDGVTTIIAMRRAGKSKNYDKSGCYYQANGHQGYVCVVRHYL